MPSKIIAIIPARGGSKSVPLKNICPFLGKPLIVHSIDTALSIPLIQRTIVSTDSSIIAEISRNAGAEVPFLRPGELANDDTLDFPVFEHCLKWLQENENFEPDERDIVLHLRPTSPLRTKEMVEQAIDLLLRHPEADSVRSVCAPSQNPFKMWTLAEDGFLKPLLDSGISEAWNRPRQKLPHALWQNGYVDVTRAKTILEKKSMTGTRILPLILDAQHTVDIDHEIMFEFAEMLYRRGKT